MCIGVTIVFLPPSLAITGYLFWYQGQRVVLSSHYERSHIAQCEVPDQSFSSYAVGLATLGGAYYAQSLAFPLIEGGTIRGRELREHALSTARHGDHHHLGGKDRSSSNNNNNNRQFTVYENRRGKEGAPGRYAPPKDLFELARRVAPPITLRIAASSVAFFCAGAVQTYVALRKQQPKTQLRGR